LEAFRDERRGIGEPDDARCPLIRECFVGRDAARRTARRSPASSGVGRIIAALR
jgi:hypothetical protein